MRSIDFSFPLNHFLFRSRASELLSRSRLVRGCVLALFLLSPKVFIADHFSQILRMSQVGGHTDLDSSSVGLQ